MRAARDQEVFERGKSSRQGLELYVAAFPDGAFAAQAHARLTAIALIEQRKQADRERAEALEVERKRVELERSRTWVTRFVRYWTKTLLSVARWGVPIEQVARENAELSRAFGRPPRPRCSFDECVKYYDSSYGVPVPGGTRVERTMRLLLRLRLKEGKLVRAELLLPQWGFSRWIELEDRTLVVDADPSARSAAVEAAFARVLPTLDELAPGRTPIVGFALGEIAPPALSASGERVDTTVEDPAAPPNRIQGSDEPLPADPSVEQLLTPEAAQPAPDMELGPLQVGPGGRAVPAGGSEMVLDPMHVPTASAPAGELVMAPLAVPAAGGTAGAPSSAATAVGTPAAPAAQPQPMLVAPAVTKAFRVGGVRLTFFAAGTDARAPAFDALVIEPDSVPSSKSPKSKALKGKPAIAPGR